MLTLDALRGMAERRPMSADPLAPPDDRPPRRRTRARLWLGASAAGLAAASIALALLAAG